MRNFSLKHFTTIQKAGIFKSITGKIFDFFGFHLRFIYKVFMGVVPADGGYQAFFRKFDLNGGKKCHICRQSLDEKFSPCSKEEYISDGEDPRVFLWQGRVFVLFYQYIVEKNETVHYLYNSEEKNLTELSIEGDFFQGKNWLPFIYREELFFIYSLEPLQILSCNGETGMCSWYYQEEGFTSRDLKFGDEHLENYTIIGTRRGGTGGHVLDGRYLFGFGHETAPDKKTRNHHVAFLFIVDLETFEIWFEYPDNINRKGLYDPCSFFIIGEDIYMALTISEDDWWFHQNFKNTIQIVERGVDFIKEYIKSHR